MIFVISILGTLLTGIVVFGGGQAFMPLFRDMWTLMGISDDKIETIFTVVNASPGVTGTQFALITGYLAAEGEWTGWLLMLVTYFVFFIPSIFFVTWAYKGLDKLETNPYLKNIVIWLKPVIAGISFAIIIQLFLTTAFPGIFFNNIGEYYGKSITLKAQFVSGWRSTAAIIFTICGTLLSYYLFHIKKVRFINIILLYVVIGILLFQPWAT